MNFRNSDCTTFCVDYVEMLTAQCVVSTMFLTLEQLLVELKVLVCIYLHLCRQESFCTNILHPRRKWLLAISQQKEPPWFSELKVIQKKISIVFLKYILIAIV